MNYDSEELEEKFSKLPKGVLDAINSVDFAQKLTKIGADNKLHIDQIDELLEEVGYVMLGDTKPDDFPAKIGTRLNLDMMQQNALVRSVDEEIFKPIKAELMSMYQGSTLKPIEVKPAPIAPAAPVEEKTERGTDYNITRDAILSEIENPAGKDALPKHATDHGLETSDPKEYLLKKEEVLKSMEEALASKGDTPKKRSLSEEALLIAKKKADEAAKSAPPAPTAETSIELPKNSTPATSSTPITPAAKMQGMVQSPRIDTTVQGPLSTSPAQTTEKQTSAAPKVDPYRELPI